MRGFNFIVAVASAGLATAPSAAFSQQLTQPSTNQNQSQLENNQSQQPPQQRTQARGQQTDQPSMNQNQPQVQTNQQQQPPQARETPAVSR